MIDDVDAEELTWGVRDVLESWWPAVLARPERLQAVDYRAYAVVTMCRMRYTFERGDVVSKPAAARWALRTVDARWHDLIRRAAARADCSYDETAAFVRETLAGVRSSASASSTPPSRGGA